LQSASNINGQSFAAMGNINISEGTLLDVTANAAGTIRIRGGQLVMNDATVSADTVNANGAATAIDINISGDVSITDTRGVPALTARTTGTGDAGAIQIVSGSLTASSNYLDPNFLNTTLLDTHTEGNGRGGDVRITTGDFVAVGPEGGGTSFILIDTGPRANGRGGDVTIEAQTFDSNSASISTGQFVASAFVPDLTTVNGSGGDISITANSLKTKDLLFDTSALFGTSRLQTGGNITITSHDISMETSIIGSTNVNGGGAVSIKADSLVTDATYFDIQNILGQGGGISIQARLVELRNGSPLISSTIGSGNAGDILITATDHVSLIGDLGHPLAILGISGFFSNSFGEIFGENPIFGTLGGPGNAGNIFVTTPTLNMVGGRINTVTSSSGHGGNVTLNVSNGISISGEFPADFVDFIPSIISSGPLLPSGVTTETLGGDICGGSCGNAGNISINTGFLNLGNGGQINSGTGGSGRGGNITINARDNISISGTISDGGPVGIFSRALGSDPNSGSGGNISLTTGQSFAVANGASVSASTTGPGNAGSILVKTNDISISGGGTITAASTGAGNAGTVTLEGSNSPANSFFVDGPGSGVFTNTQDTGAGGSISVDANAVTLQNGGTISASTSGSSSSATGGNISISGGQFVQMNNGASITASSTGLGNTGNIQINAGNQFTMTNSTVTTEAKQSGGGAIKITTNPDGTVQLNDSVISASVLDGTGGGGSVDIDPQFVILQNSQILANAVFGPGGNINITTNLLLPDTASVIDASSQFGQSGTVTIQSPVSPASGKLVPLGQKPLIATSLLSQRCAALAGGSISSFTVAGRDSLPAEPGGWVSSPLAFSMTESRDGTVRETDSMMPGEANLLSVRKISPPGFLTQSFAVDSSDCQS
jgi:large exoprotein involved in heme utilization and adhesion